MTNFIPCKVSEDRKHLIVKDGKDSKIEYVVSEKHKEEVILCVRLEDITLKPYNEGEMNGQVIRATYLGNLVDYLLQVGEITMRVQLKDRRFSTGDKVSLIIDKEKILLY